MSENCKINIEAFITYLCIRCVFFKIRHHVKVDIQTFVSNNLSGFMFQHPLIVIIDECHEFLSPHTCYAKTF